MKSAILAVCCLAVLASGQWVEGYILLPDSFGGLTNPGRLLHIPSGSCTYVFGAGPPGEGGAVVFDDSAQGRTGRFVLETGVEDLCHCPGFGKAYCVGYSPTRGRYVLTAIDVMRHRVTAVLELDHTCRVLEYNPAAGKLYCADRYGLTVFNCAADTVVAHVPLPWDPTVMACSPDANELYAWVDDDAVYVVDCVNDSVVARIDPGSYAVSLCFDPERSMLYCGRSDGRVCVLDMRERRLLHYIPVGRNPIDMVHVSGSRRIYVACAGADSVAVIDAVRHLLLTRIKVGRAPELLVWDSLGNRVFCLNGRDDELSVIDCDSNEVVATVQVGANTVDMVWSPGTNLVICANSNSADVTFIDAATARVESSVSVGSSPIAMCYDSDADRLYVADFEGDEVLAFDGSNQRKLSAVEVAVRPVALCFNRQHSKLYSMGWGSSETTDAAVTVVDTRGDTVLATVPLSKRPGGLCCLPSGDRVYCSEKGVYSEPGSTLVAIHGATNAIVGRVEVGQVPGALVAGPDGDRVYCGGDSVRVVDVASNRVVRTIGTPGGNLCLSPATGKLYCAGQLGLTVVDTGSDTIVTRLDSVEGRLMAWNPTFGKLYCAGSRDIYVVDGTEDSVLARIEGAIHWSEMMLYDSIYNILFIAGHQHGVVVMVDGAADSVLGWLTAGEYVPALAWNPRHRRIYAANIDESSISVFRTDPPGIHEHRLASEPEPRLSSALVRGSLLLRGKLTAELLDVAGRRVTSLQPGNNDVWHVAPGVYFIRRPETEDGRPRAAVRKVVIQR